MAIQRSILEDLLNSSLKQEELAGLTPDMLLEASFRSHQNVKNPFEFDYNQRASKVLHEKMFFDSPKRSSFQKSKQESSQNSFEDRD